MQRLFGGRVYGSQPYPSVIFEYEYTRSGANMKYRFHWKVYLETSGGWYYNNIRFRIVLNNSEVFVKDCKSSSAGWSFEGTTDWYTVANKTSGTTPVYFTAIDTQNSGWCNYTSSTYNLTVAPAYASITQYDLSAINETSIKFTWSASHSCDAIQYSINGGSWTNGAYPTTTISDLSANTQYSVKIRVRRKDSQLWTTSALKYVTTYDYPYCTSSPNFTIGNSLKLDFYNPLNRSITVNILGNGDKIIGNWSGTGTTISGFNDTNSINNQYASIPNTATSTYKVQVIYGDITKTRDNGNTYAVDLTKCTPTFSNFTYKDNNSVVTGVTGNNQVLVKGLSTLQVIISSSNKMIANKSATGKNYSLSFADLSKTVNYSSSDLSIDLGKVTSSGTQRLNVRAYDSRNNSTLVYKDVTVYDYTKPVINTSITRLNNFESQTTIKVSGTYTRLSINGADKNTITKVEYRYREKGGNWGAWTQISTTVTAGKYTCNDVIVSLDNTKEFDIEVKTTDSLSDNTIIGNVGVGKAIFMISSNKKKCYINGIEVPTINDIPKPTDIIDIIKAVYPVGAIYISTVATNPGTLFGFGAWEQIKDKFLLGAGDTYINGSTGGNVTEIKTKIGVSGSQYGGIGGANYKSRVMVVDASLTNDKTAMKYLDTYGYDMLPPYLTVYMWKRIS